MCEGLIESLSNKCPWVRRGSGHGGLELSPPLPRHAAKREEDCLFGLPPPLSPDHFCPLLFSSSSIFASASFHPPLFSVRTNPSLFLAQHRRTSSAKAKVAIRSQMQHRSFRSSLPVGQKVDPYRSEDAMLRWSDRSNVCGFRLPGRPSLRPSPLDSANRSRCSGTLK